MLSGGYVVFQLSREDPSGASPEILAVFSPPLKQIGGCLWLLSQAQKGTLYLTDLAERVEHGNSRRIG